MKIPAWIGKNEQMCNLSGLSWSVPRLIELSRDLPVMDIPLDHLCVYNTFEKLSLRQMVMHMRAVIDSDLSFPIIMDEDGDIMDGRHRIMKAMLNGDRSIKAVRFDINPPPCREAELVND